MEHVEAQLDAAEEREEMTERQPEASAFCWATELALCGERSESATSNLLASTGTNAGTT